MRGVRPERALKKGGVREDLARVVPHRHPPHLLEERELFDDNVLVRIHFIIVMIRWTGLAPGSLNAFF